LHIDSTAEPHLREARLHQLAQKRGLVLKKANSTSREAGRFHIVDPTVNGIMGSRHRSFPFSFSLKEAEEWFASRRRRSAKH
jgi:hypothetical protein